MKKNFTFILMWLFCIFSLNTTAQTQFWSETFETAPSSGTRTPQGSGGIGTPATSYFKLTDGSDVSQVVTLSGKEGSNYWAGEDHNAAGTGLPSAGAGTDDSLNELEINWTGINITGKEGLSFKGLFAANSTSQAWDNKQACLSGIGTTNTDYIIVEYQIDGGAWTNLIRFYNKGSASGSGLTWKNLYEDTDNNGCGDGLMLTESFGEFEKTIEGTGSTMALRIRVYSEGNNEEWGIDNFRLLETICVPPVVTVNPENRAICVGGNTSFSSTVTGATSYQWQVDTGSGFTNVTDGGMYSNATTNTLTITGAIAEMTSYQYRCKAINGGASCFINTNAATLSVSNIIASVTSQTNVACNGGTTGSATIVASGGIGTLSYSWSPSGGTASTATGLSAGTYTVTITDENSCQISKTVTIDEPTALNTLAGSKTDVSCNGGSNGTATVSPTGGTAPYTYSWSTSGGTGATASGLAAGTYTVTVTDANSCQATRTFTISQPTAALSATTGGESTNVSCFGGSNGTATVSPTGGTAPYTYSWSPSGGTGATAAGLAAGTYTVTVTDANSCQTTRTFTISQPTAALSATTGGGSTNVSCFGGANGTATVSPTGGTAPYTYSWSPSGGTAATASSLTAGTYTITVTDANSCQTTRTFTITEPTVLIASAAAQTNVSCNGGSNGSATVSVTGGTGAYTYAWSPSGGTAATASGLMAGTYTVTVTDDNYCTTTQSFTITEPTVLIASAASQTNVSCNSGSNGSATVSVTGGTGAYTYAWSPSGGTAATASGLTAGTYTVTVTDANACTATQSFTITEPTVLIASAAAKTNVSCNGGSNGSATVSVTGGTGAYTYTWSPSGGTAATASDLTAGTYTVTVTDANACTATQSFTITEPTALIASAAAQTNVSCNGGSNGSATVNVTGGTGTYTYAWSPSGGTAATATGLTAGTYIVTVTDANACTATQSFTITEPTVLIASAAAQTNVSCNSGSNGSATVNVTGGTGAYTYAWSPSGGSAATASGLTAGIYVVTVTDANSCTTTQSFMITEPAAALVASATSQTNVSCYLGSNGTATVNATGGTGAYTYSWSPSGGTAATATGLTAGTYVVTVTDANSCTATQSFTITEPAVINFITTSLSGYDYNSSYSQTITSTGGTGSITYSVTAGSLPSGLTLSLNGEITGTSTQVADSNFTVTATDANGCIATYDFTLRLNQIPITVTATASQTKVYGESDPVLTYTVTPDLLTGDSFTGTLARTAGENIGSYTINQGTLSAGDKYLISYVANDFAITAKPITVTADASQSKVYGTANPVYTYSVSPALVSGDAFTGALTRTAGENIGNYAITQGTLSAGSNYTISYASTDFTISAKPITVTADASQTKVYGTANPVYTYSVSPVLVSGDTFTGALTRDAGENIGNYAITQGTLSAGNNYTISYVSKDFAITAKPITVTADASQTKVYGTTNPVYTYSVSPALVSGDTFTGALTRDAGENIGNYAITQGTLSAGNNYNITYVAKDFAITAKPITVTADASQTKVYGTVDPIFTYTVSPALISGDTFSGTLTRDAGENIGNYAITQGTLSAGSNYTISYVSKDFAITAKPITVTADASQTKVYGTANPVYTYSVSPALISGDTFTGALTRTAGENIGNYAITQGTLSAGSNYTISYASTDFTITAKPITVTADASQTKVYGTANPVYTYSVSPALVSGDTFTGALTRTAGENIGNYAITQGTLSAGSNYTISYVSKDFAITAKPITVTADAAQTKVYGTANPVYTYSVSPALVSGDTFTGALTRDAGENVGSYAITQGTLSAGINYIITYTGANFSITKADQIITWNQSLGLGCDGETSLVLTAVSNSGLAVNYTSSNTNVATISNGVVNFQNYGSATIIASQEGTINYNAAPEVVLPVVNSQPNLIRKQFEDIIFFDNSSKNFMSYSWYKNGVLVAGQTSQFFKENGALNGTYYAIATKLDGTLITTCPLTLSPTVEEEYIKIAPNPVRSNGDFQLITNVNSSRLQNARIELYTITGNMLININTSQNTVDLKAPTVEGIYIVKMTLANGKYFTKNLLVKN